MFEAWNEHGVLTLFTKFFSKVASGVLLFALFVVVPAKTKGPATGAIIPRLVKIGTGKRFCSWRWDRRRQAHLRQWHTSMEIIQIDIRARLVNQLHPFERRCHNAVKISPETGVSSWGWEAYILSCPATWQDGDCIRSKNTQWML